MTIITLPAPRRGRAPLLHTYPGEVTPQRAHVTLAENGGVYADWDPETGGAMPARVWHGRSRRYSVSPHLTGAELTALIKRLRPLLQRVHDGHTVEWDGSNHVGRLTADAAEAEEQIKMICDGLQP